MSYQIWQPVETLRPYVRHLAISRAESPDTYTVLPDTSLVVGFQFSGRISHLAENIERSLDVSGITGLLDQYRIFKNTGGTSSILIVFTETGAAAFLATPLHELFGQSLSLEHFFTRADINETREKLEAARTDNERLRIVEAFLLRQLKELKADQMVAVALHYIYQSKGTIRITKLAELLHSSQSPLEKRFRALVGASPKKFAGIVRARYVLDALNKNDQDTAEYLSAFYDQAHFIKDFKKFSSMTPEQYLRMLRQGKK
ncbi:AraC family transcriptional regulator [Mucilaginibacter sp. AK015]|uniref:helix-turn-helix domain-containing protein n=1 Tax=Mucilaginibacter sp. AK015 TaxID=2723072 RepID=UPI0016200E8E|nr:helix-turn-helix domain-containing protein [Mucilaginibacter sp. AK015]MBB5395223.1 AraC-like DNA-binding protein [Mucilaginibacter sp. AK015]